MNNHSFHLVKGRPQRRGWLQPLLLWAGLWLLSALTGYAQTSPATFTYTGGTQTFTVPAGVTSLTVVAKGAAGGASLLDMDNGAGGKGGTVSAILSVTPGQVLTLEVGGQGLGGVDGTSNNSSYNGGGKVLDYYNVDADGSGGGATDIRVGGTDLANRVIVAGGGGGGKYDSDATQKGFKGGNGGGLTGSNGEGSWFDGSGGGSGGTQSAGGQGNDPFDYTDDGVLGIGGLGTYGGGGGGGYYGGGSGSFSNNKVGGGGGGSSYTDPTRCTSVSYTQGDNDGDGRITLSWEAAAPVQNGPSCDTYVNKTTDNDLGDNFVKGVYAVATPGSTTVYAATNGGLSISTDGGSTFTNKTTNDGLGNSSVNGVYAVGSTVYAATTGGLGISTDGGSSFTNKTRTANNLANDFVRGVYAVAGSPGSTTVYAATDNGLSISTDGGNTFLGPKIGGFAVYGVYAVGNTVYAAVGNGLYISTDGGNNFTRKRTSNGLASNAVNGVYAVGNTVYAATDGGLSISTDGGNSFTLISNDLLNTPTYGVYALGNTVYAATGVGLSISTDGGNTFANKTTTSGLGSNTVRGVYALGNTVYAATDGGLSFCGSTAPCSLSVSIAATPSLTITSGGSVTLTASGADSYTWSDGSAANPLVLTNVTSATTVSVTGVTGACSATASAAVNVAAALPDPPVIAAVGPATVCQGTSLTIGAGSSCSSGTITYTYASDDYPTSQTASPANGLLVLTIQGAYTITATCSTTAGTSLPSSPIQVQINTNPTVTITGGNVAICAGQSLTLGTQVNFQAQPSLDASQSPYTYIWSPGPVSQDNAAGTAVVQPQTTTAYTVKVTDANNCSVVSAPVSVTVNALPSLTITANPSLTINSGQSTTLTASGANSYSWSTGESTATVSVTAGVYSVTGTSASGCSSTTSVSVYQRNCQTSIAASAPAVCVDKTLSLTATAQSQVVLPQPIGIGVNAAVGPTYSWVAPAGATLSGTSTSVVSASFTTSGVKTFTATVTTVDGCVSSTTISVTVNALPSLTITATPSLTINSGQSTTLTASGANSYSWSTGESTATVSVTAGVYSVTGTSASGCSSTTSVSVYQRNCQTSIAASATAVCVDKTVSLTATAQSQVVLPQPIGIGLNVPAGPTYSWVAPAGATLSSTNTSVVSASFTTSGVKTFTATVTTVEGCVSSTTVSVTVNALPSLTITAAPSLTVNSGQSTTLTASGANSYSWSTGESTSMVSVTAGVYSVTGTSASGCSSTTSVSVYQRNCQTSIAASATAVCVDKTLSLTATAQSQVVLPQPIGIGLNVPAGPTYSWVAPPGTTLSSTNTSVVSASFTTSGVKTFTATVTTVEGCVSSTTVSVTVNALPTPTIAGNLTLCIGQSTTLTASEASSYTWNTGESTSAIMVSPTSTTAYSVTVTNASGCVSSTAVTVTVNPLPTPTLSALPSSTLTGGLATTLTAGGGATYAFSGPGLLGQNPTAGTATANQAGVYSVTVTSALGCAATTSLTLTLPQPLFTSCGSPTATLGQPLQLVEPAYNCATGLIQFRTIGGDGSPITYSAIGITTGTSSCTAYLNAEVAQDIRDQLLHVEPFTLVVVQNGQRVTYSWNALAACAGQPAPLNLAPIAPVIPPAVAKVGTSFSLTVPTFADPNGDALTYNVLGLPANGLSFNATTRLISGTPSLTGLVSLTAVASDPAGLSAAAPISISVIAPVSGTLNQAPIAPVLANQAATVGTPFAFAVPAFTDPNGDALIYDVTGLPANGLNFDAGSRLISGTPSTTGVVAVSVTATDPGGLTAVASFSIVVSASAVVGGPLVLLAPTYDCQTGAFSFRSSGGTGGLIEYRAVGITDWTPTASGYTVRPPSDAGPFILQARQNGVIVSLSFDWKAYCSQPTPPAQNQAPVASVIANQTASVGSFFTLTIPAFSDPNGDALTYKLTQVPPTGLSFNVNTRVLSGVPAETGVIGVSVLATDPGGLTAVASFSITVGPAVAVAPGLPGLPNQVGTVGTPFSYVVPAFSGTGPISYTATGLPAGLGFDAGSRTIAGTPTQPGVSTVVIAASNAVGQVSGQFTITVSGVPTGPATLTITSFTCNSPNSVLSSVDFVVGYTNGSFSPAVPPLLVIGVTASGELGTAYRLNFDPNQNSLTVQDNASRSVYFVWNFRDACANGPVVLPPVAPQVPVLPNQVATVGSGFSYVVPSFGGTGPVSYSATGLPTGLSFDAGSRSITGVPSATGVSTVVVSASNAVGQVSGQFTLTVSGSVAQPTGPATLGITSYSCNSGNGVLTSVDFVVGYTNGSFSPSVPPLFINGVTASGVLGQSYRLNFDPNQNSLTVADNANRSQVYFVWNFRVACAAVPARLGVEPLAAWSVSVLGNPPVTDYAELEVANGAGRTLSVSVVDESGRALRQSTVSVTESVQRVRVSLGASAGVYLLQVSDGVRQQTLRVLHP